MSRRRYLSTDISTDARVAQLSEFGQLLYTWMLPHADDQGGITADPQELKMLVVPGLSRRKPADVKQAVDAMLSLELIECEGHRLFFPAAPFYKYQTYVTAERRRSAQNAATIDFGGSAADQRKTPQNAASVSVSVSPSPSVSVSSTPPTPPSAASAAKGGDRADAPRRGRRKPEPGSLKAAVIAHFDALANGSSP